MFLFLFYSTFVSASGYYYKGEFFALSNEEFIDPLLLQYSKENGENVRITNKLILKLFHEYEDGYFESKYNIKNIKKYGKVYVFEVNDIQRVLELCQKIYENESVVYVQPSFVKKINQNWISFENLKASRQPLNPRIISHSGENNLSMLDSENSVNYWKYYDDVFRYQDESFWHLHNKGGFITQTFYQDEFYDISSHEDVDANVLQVIDRGITGKGVRLAVVDSSFELTHPDLHFSDSHNFYLNNKDVTPNSTADFHGTAVAGVIGANKGNNYAIMGVAPDVYMLAFSGLFDIEDDEIFSQSYIDIFYKALELNIDIMNCSWSTLESIDEASEDAIINRCVSFRSPLVIQSPLKYIEYLSV